jgi:hypothetical protein
MVALNFQTFDRGMQLNMGLFKGNGGCGFVRKPKSLLNMSGLQCESGAELKKDKRLKDGGCEAAGDDVNEVKGKRNQRKWGEFLELTIISGQQLPRSNRGADKDSDPQSSASYVGFGAVDALVELEVIGIGFASCPSSLGYPGEGAGTLPASVSASGSPNSGFYPTSLSRSFKESGVWGMSGSPSVGSGFPRTDSPTPGNLPASSTSQSAGSGTGGGGASVKYRTKSSGGGGFNALWKEKFVVDLRRWRGSKKATTKEQVRGDSKALSESFGKGNRMFEIGEVEFKKDGYNEEDEEEEEKKDDDEDLEDSIVLLRFSVIVQGSSSSSSVATPLSAKVETSNVSSESQPMSSTSMASLVSPTSTFSTSSSISSSAVGTGTGNQTTVLPSVATTKEARESEVVGVFVIALDDLEEGA